MLMGRYKVLKVRGRGGYGVVCKGFDTQLERYVAIKLERPGLRNTYSSFKDEARKLAQLRHRAIVTVYDYGVDGEQPFIITNWVSGKNVAECREQQKPFDYLQTAAVVLWVAEALSAAHAQGITHRDVKPQNILVEIGGQVFLTDFGIAVTAQELASGAVPPQGTRRYMAPEQSDPDAEITPAVDIYALGAVLYELLTGHVPSETHPLWYRLLGKPRSPHRYDRKIPQQLVDICMTALHRDPEQRFASAADMAAFVRDFVISERERQLYPPEPFLRLLRRVAIQVAVIVGLIAAACYLHKAHVFERIFTALSVR
jgi:serine/threonine protein kinase